MVPHYLIDVIEAQHWKHLHYYYIQINTYFYVQSIALFFTCDSIIYNNNES